MMDVPSKTIITRTTQYPIYLMVAMYGIVTYIWVMFRANVATYSSTMEHMGIKYMNTPLNRTTTV